MTPIVLLHAFPQTSAMWRGVAETLAGHCEVFCPELPGFGGAPISDWSFDTLADAIARVITIRFAGKPHPIIGGCSMGGYVALAIARRHPDKLSGLVLMNTRADADTPDQKASREVNLRLVEQEGVAELVEKMLPRLLGKTTHELRSQVVDEVRELGAAQPNNAVSDALIAMRDRPDSTPDLANIAVPTLVICGAEDELTPPSVGEAMAAQIPGARVVTIPACGHLSPWEDPGSVADAILGHFGR